MSFASKNAASATGILCAVEPNFTSINKEDLQLFGNTTSVFSTLFVPLAAYENAAAATGRLCAMDPNVISVNKEDLVIVGNNLRALFVPSVPGWRILSADYSQVWVWVWVWETTHRYGCGCGCQCTHAACRILQSGLSARVAHPFSRLLTGMGVGVGVGDYS